MQNVCIEQKSDLLQRHTFPYVMAMMGDGIKSYDNDKDGSEQQFAGCEVRHTQREQQQQRSRITQQIVQADFRAKGFPTRARLTYHKNNYLQLELMWREEDQWDQCFKKREIVLPEQIYLGFSAHTGEVYDNHDIISVVTKSIPPAVKEVAPPPQNNKKKSGSGSSVLGVLFKIVLAGALVGVLFVGYRFYDQRNRMKRF